MAHRARRRVSLKGNIMERSMSIQAAFTKAAIPLGALGRMALIMAVAAGIASCSIFTGPGNDTTKVKVTGTGVAVLANLGVPTKLAPRTQVGGAAMLDSENPFGKNVIDTKVINEIFTISQDNKAKLINVPGVSAGTATDLPVNIDGLGGTTGQIKRPVAADLDGDGKKEILMANFNLTAKTIGFFKINRGTSYAVQSAGQISWNTKRSWSDGRDYFTYWHWAGIFWVNDSSAFQHDSLFGWVVSFV